MPCKIAMRRFAVRFQHELHGFAKISTRFVQRRALRVGAGQFFDDGDEAFKDLNVDGVEINGSPT